MSEELALHTNRINALTAQNYVTVQATQSTTAADIPTLINATGDGEQTDTIYRVGFWDGSAFDGSKYSEYAWDGTSYIQLNVRTGSLDGVFDISEYNTSGGNPAVYDNLTQALAGVPPDVQRGGMSVKYVQRVPAMYSVVVTQSDTQPTGTALVSASSVTTGTYDASALTDFSTLPPATGAGNAVVYYYTDGSTYTIYPITMANAETTEYVQYRLMATDWSAVVNNWVNNRFSTGQYVSNVSIATGVNARDQGLVKSDDAYKIVEEMHSKIGGVDYYRMDVSQPGRSETYNVEINSGYTVKVTLLACRATLSSGIRIRGIKDTTPVSYIQFGKLTSVGQTLTIVLDDHIIGIDTYNNDAYTASSYKIEWEKAITGSINEETSEIEGNVSSLTGRVGTLETASASLEALAAESGEKVTITTSSSGEGKVISYSDFTNPKSPVDSSNYNITDAISVPAHGMIATFCGGSMSRISKVVGGNQYISLVQGINNKNTCVSWINNSDESVNVVICYLATVDPVAFIHKNVFSSILATIPNIEQYGKLQDTTPNLTMVAGSVSNGNINTSSSTYVHSEPFFANKNDLIILINSRSDNNVALLYKTDANASYAEHIVHGVSGTTVQHRYYVCKESGYYGISGQGSYLSMKKYTPSAGYVQSVGEDGKKKVGITYSKTAGDNDITISDAPYCQITKGAGVRISGSGNCTITGTLDEPVLGRCASVGYKIPYGTQDVAAVTINDDELPVAPVDARTASGKGYRLDGTHYHRTNYNIKYSALSSFTITIESESNWEIEMSSEAVINDDLPLTPILVGYDMAHNYQATFPYEGENISVFELHKRLHLPYYVSTYPGAIINTEIAEAVEAGLCELVFYNGGNLVDYWDNTDGTLAQEIFKRTAGIGAGARMVVASQGVIDRNLYTNIKNAGTEILRCHSTLEDRYCKFSSKYGDNDIFYVRSSALGYATITNILRLPQVWYAHGVGTPTNPDDPYAQTHYVDRDGTNTKSLFSMWKTMQEQGRVMVMKPSDWLAYCRKYDCS